MTPIRITHQQLTREGWSFDIKIGEGHEGSQHTIELGQDYYLQLTNRTISPEDLVINSIRFLLERESQKQFSLDLT